MGIIDVQNLNKTYANKLVLNNLSLSLGSGQIVGLLGPNGCGKSTLIKILAGVISDYDGNAVSYTHLDVYKRQPPVLSRIYSQFALYLCAAGSPRPLP